MFLFIREQTKFSTEAKGANVWLLSACPHISLAERGLTCSSPDRRVENKNLGVGGIALLCGRSREAMFAVELYDYHRIGRWENSDRRN